MAWVASGIFNSANSCYLKNLTTNSWPWNKCCVVAVLDKVQVQNNNLTSEGLSRLFPSPPYNSFLTHLVLSLLLLPHQGGYRIFQHKLTDKWNLLPLCLFPWGQEGKQELLLVMLRPSSLRFAFVHGIEMHMCTKHCQVSSVWAAVSVWPRRVLVVQTSLGGLVCVCWQCREYFLSVGVMSWSVCNVGTRHFLTFRVIANG